MGSAFDCEDCTRLVAGADRQAVLDAVERHEDDTDHSMKELDLPEDY